MKINNLLYFSLIFLITSCSQNPQNILNEAKDKILNSTRFNYHQLALYPNPVGKIDSFSFYFDYHKSKENKIDYDFLARSKEFDEVYIDGNYKTVNHKDSIVRFTTESGTNLNENSIKYSPLTLLKQTWRFVQDTLVSQEKQLNFSQTETDTLIDGNKIHTERHIFVNEISKLIDRFERRNYFNGQLSQKVIHQYSDYNFHNTIEKLVYEFPANYKSIPFGQVNAKPLLKIGENAPGFTSQNIKNTIFNIDDYKGQKVLLNFSAINCGFCKLALKHFNQKDYRLSNKINGVYLNIDKRVDVVDYINKINVPFQVIADAKEFSELYGVFGYPTFFLIDEFGVIENVVVGYNEEFLESLKM
ncbi:TlpA disulfide reductase family protein [Reichenbachiella sp. MALMAid0571]|uniref:TlpA family protein disulfide reductase n=1 Tax=Reichenbachiella sp. MALMAid0571 TaxID=3143939 RepID=UPI0032E044DA